MEEALRAAGIWTPERARRVEFAIPRDAAHGDWTTNIAMVLARELKQPPRKLAEQLAAAFPADPSLFERVDVAGAGFVNFTYAEPFLRALPRTVTGAGDAFGTSDLARGERVLVEYVSANPTGPLNVVSARAAAVGATLVRLLRAAGHAAEGEFYVNDAGTQVDLLGASLAARFAQRIGLITTPIASSTTFVLFLIQSVKMVTKTCSRLAWTAASGRKATNTIRNSLSTRSPGIGMLKK
jgi:arginyl-tRNA synthetase